MRGDETVPFYRIESPDNARVKGVCALQKSRAERENQGKLVIENPVMLSEALANGITVTEAYFDDAADPALAALCGEKGAQIFSVSDRVMKKMTALEAPQGVCAVIERASLPKFDLHTGGRYLVCERLGDPGNLGTIIRTADAMGFDGVVLSKGSVDATSPKVIRATMGSLFRLPVQTEVDLPAFLTICKGLAIPTVAAVLDRNAKPAHTLPTDNGAAILIGNEAAGLTPDTVSRCECTAFIPMAGKAESLNAAVAASIFLWLFRKP